MMRGKRFVRGLLGAACFGAACLWAACLPNDDGLPGEPPPPPGEPPLTPTEYEGVRDELPTSRPDGPPSLSDPPEHLEVLGDLVPSWAPGFGDCQVVASMPSDRAQLGTALDPATRELVTVGDFVREVTYAGYHWRSSDGAQVKLFRDVDHPSDVYATIAGSAPNMGPDLNSLFENLASQSNAFPRRGYVEMVRLALLDGIRRMVPAAGAPPYRLFLTGHSQGGNVAQVVAAGMLGVEPADGFLAGFQWVDEPEWVELRQAMADAQVELGGVIAVASRPAGPMVALNNELDGRDTFTLFVQSLEDNVPRLTSPGSVAVPDCDPTGVDGLPGACTQELGGFWDHVGAFSGAISGLTSMIPGAGWLWQQVQVDLADNWYFQIEGDLDGRKVVTTRSQVVFAGNGDRHPENLGRGPVDAHGQQYLDPRVGQGPGAHRAPVAFDDFLQLTVPADPAEPSSEAYIQVLANDWHPLGNEDDLRVTDVRVLPRCRLITFDPSCPSCAPIEQDAPPAVEALCQGTATVEASETAITYRAPTMGVAENARVLGLEPAVGQPGWFARPTDPSFAMLGPQPLGGDDYMLVLGTYADLVYTVEDADGERSEGYVRVHLVPPSPDGEPVLGPWAGGPFQTPRPHELQRPPSVDEEVSWDEQEIYPAQAPLSHYLPRRRPDQQPLRTPLELEWVGGYGYDCRASYLHDEPTWVFYPAGADPAMPGPDQPIDLCTGETLDLEPHPYLTTPFRGSRLVSYVHTERLRRFPDDIPDTLWVDPNSTHDGSVRDPNYYNWEQGIREWTLDGADEATAEVFFNEHDLVFVNRTYVSCPDPGVCAGDAPPPPAFVGTSCPESGGDVDWDAMRAEVASVNDPGNLLLAVEIPYDPPSDWPGFESGPCGSFTYELPVPCDGYQDYLAWNMGGAIATFRVRPGLPPIFNNWVSNAGYFAEGMMDPFYMHPNKTVDIVDCMGGGGFGGCSFGTFGDGLDDTGLPVCNEARGQTMPGPMQPGEGAYGGRIRAFPVYRRSAPDPQFPEGWRECYDRISLAAQGGGTPVACQSGDGLEHGSIFVAFQATCEEEAP